MSLKIDRVQLEIEIKTDTNRQRLRQLDEELKKTSGELRKVKEGTEEHARASEHYKKLKSEYDQILSKIGLNNLSLKELKARQAELNMIIRNLDPSSKSYKELKLQLDQVKARMSELNGHAKQTGFSIGKMADGFNKYFGVITAGVASFAGLLIGARKAVDEFNQFEEKLANLSAITGVVGSDLEYFSEQSKKTSTSVREDGIRITASADSILDAYTLMGSAKPELLANKEALHAVTEEALIMATAAKMEAAPAIDALAVAMNQFSAPAEEAGRYTNVLAAGSKYGSAMIPEVATAITKFGAAAASANVSIEESVAAVEVLAEKGIKGEIAGTALKMMMVKLQTGADQFNPKIHGMSKALDNLANANLSVADMAKIFGQENIVQAQIMVENRKRFDELTKSVTDTNVAYEQAAINSETNAAKLAQARNKAQLLRIEFGEKLAPALTFSTNAFSYFLKIVMNAPAILDKYKSVIVALIAVIIIWQQALIKSAALKLKDHLLMKEGIGLKLKEAIQTKAQAIQEEYRAAMIGKSSIAQKAATISTIAFKNALSLLGGPIGWVTALLGALALSLIAYDKYSAKSVALANDKQAAIDRLAASNKLLDDTYTKNSKSIQNLAVLSVKEKQDLKDKIDLTLKLAEAELINMEAKQKQIQQDNTRVTGWQKFKSLLTSFGNTGAMAVNDITTATLNGIDAAEKLNDPITKLRDNITKIQEQKGSLDDIFGAEQAGDKIKGDSITALEEKVNKYQLALKNAALGSADYTRIQQKLATSQGQLNKLTQLGTQLTGEDTEKQNKAADDKLKKQREIDKALIDMMPESYEKELALASYAYEEKQLWIEKEISDQAQKQQAIELSYAQHIEKLKAIYDKNYGALSDPFSKESAKFYSDKGMEQVGFDEEESSDDSALLDLNGPKAIQEKLAEDYKRRLFMESLDFQRQELLKHLNANEISQKEYNDKIAAMDAAAAKLKADNIAATFGALGELMGGVLGESKNATLVKIGLSTAEAIASLVAVSEANPLNTLTFGGAGIAQYIAGIARITANIAAAKKAIKGKAEGKYPVRATTGTYMATIAGQPLTGLVMSPTAFMAGEKGTEMIIDNPTYRHLQANFPAAIDAIYHSRRNMRGYADGKYPEQQPSPESEKMMQIMNRVGNLLDKVDRTGVGVAFDKISTAETEVESIKSMI